MGMFLRRGASGFLEVIWPDGERTDGPAYKYAKKEGWVPAMRSGQRIPLTFPAA